MRSSGSLFQRFTFLCKHWLDPFNLLTSSSADLPRLRTSGKTSHCILGKIHVHAILLAESTVFSVRQVICISIARSQKSISTTTFMDMRFMKADNSMSTTHAGNFVVINLFSADPFARLSVHVGATVTFFLPDSGCSP